MLAGWGRACEMPQRCNERSSGRYIAASAWHVAGCKNADRWKSQVTGRPDESVPVNRRVVGSSPTSGSIKFNNLQDRSKSIANGRDALWGDL
jgi:hypothetical protein